MCKIRGMNESGVRATERSTAEKEARENVKAESAKADRVVGVQEVMRRQPLNNLLQSPLVKGFYPLGTVVGQ